LLIIESGLLQDEGTGETNAEGVRTKKPAFFAGFFFW
jgi:hypothetical protein